MHISRFVKFEENLTLIIVQNYDLLWGKYPINSADIPHLRSGYSADRIISMRWLKKNRWTISNFIPDFKKSCIYSKFRPLLFSICKLDFNLTKILGCTKRTVRPFIIFWNQTYISRFVKFQKTLKISEKLAGIPHLRSRYI